MGEGKNDLQVMVSTINTTDIFHNWHKFATGGIVIWLAQLNQYSN